MWKLWALVLFRDCVLAAPSYNNKMIFPNCVNGILARNAACDIAAPPSERAAAVVAAMNITEKLSSVVDGNPGAPRIGLPPYEWWNEGLHGVGGSAGVFWDFNSTEFSYATVFAMPILMSASFNDDLIEEVAKQISTEARAFSNNGRAGLDFWTPNINPYKDPRWGRGSETPGEDPLRIKGYVKSYVRGLEGDKSKTREVIATCKHFAAYDLEDWGGVTRYAFNAIVSLQDLSEYYLPPFQQCARDSNVGSIMCSYNAINGTPACANSYLMEDILRNHWGWTKDNNYITSDCGAVQYMFQYHNYTSDAAHAAAIAFTRGMDLICELGYVSNVTGAYEQSLIAEETLDKVLSKLYEGLVRVGYFDGTNAEYRDIEWSEVNTAEAQELARKSAEEGIVLKKNDGTLPLELQNKVVAVIGFWANATAQMIGGYSGYPPYYHNPLYAANRLASTVLHADGPIAQNNSVPDNWTVSAMDAASRADIIIYCGGNDNSIENEELDRTSIAWPDSQLELIGRLGSLGKPLVILQLGDQNDDTPLLQNANVSAVVWAGFPGQDGGTAAFNIITGQTAPAGRLPVTQYPAAYADTVLMTDMTLRPSAENPGRTYRWFQDAVLPFGYGLHYTTFDAKFAPTQFMGSYDITSVLQKCRKAKVTYLDLCTFTSIQVEVENTGRVQSDFIALLFVRGEYGPTPYPLKSLASYKRLKAIQPGQVVKGLLQLTLGTLARVDERGDTVIYPGNYQLLLDVPTQSWINFTLTGSAVVLDEFPQPSEYK